jgi:hypothetical protein
MSSNSILLIMAAIPNGHARQDMRQPFELQLEGLQSWRPFVTTGVATWLEVAKRYVVDSINRGALAMFLRQSLTTQPARRIPRPA